MHARTGVALPPACRVAVVSPAILRGSTFLVDMERHAPALPRSTPLGVRTPGTLRPV